MGERGRSPYESRGHCHDHTLCIAWGRRVT